MKFPVFERDSILKLVALVIAIISWFYIMGDMGLTVFFFNKEKKDATRIMKAIPIVVMQTSENIRGNIRVKPTAIDLVIKGDKGLVTEAVSTDFLVYVDVSHFSDGTYDVIIQHVPLIDVRIVDFPKTATIDMGVEWSNESKKEPEVTLLAAT